MPMLENSVHSYSQMRWIDRYLTYIAISKRNDSFLYENSQLLAQNVKTLGKKRKNCDEIIAQKNMF